MAPLWPAALSAVPGLCWAVWEKPAARLAPFLWGGGESWPAGRHSGAWGLAGIAAGFGPVRAATRSGTAGPGPEGLSGGDAGRAAGDNEDVTAGPGLPATAETLFRDDRD